MAQEVNRSFWVGGLHAVEESIAARPETVLEVLVDRDSAKSPPLAALLAKCRQSGLKARLADRRELDRAASGRHQGAAARIAAPRRQDLREFLRSLPEAGKKDAVLVALDQVQDPHNLGAIARSAANLGASGLIITEHRSSPVTPTAIAASAGAIQKIQVFQVVNLCQALAVCREAGFWIYGADAEGEPVWKTALNRPLVLVIGSEGEGIRRLVRESCDGLISIPQSAGGVESLNASCAASVLLYEIWRQGTAS
ncbi:MAG: 23S rRNA (guanosine(2251)-2'-O)-methyltransferase RlmB [Elusimicrobia bacterium]|nr:23S rRNA (guanosine(2251)-2'-O)-methyltransferase RlmB [Elusimicrobiota bacterium]